MATGVGGFTGSRVAVRLVRGSIRVVGGDDFSSGPQSARPLNQRGPVAEMCHGSENG